MYNSNNNSTVIQKCGMLCLYTNADSLMNKREELIARIAEHSPDIIFITEVLPKNSNGQIESSELSIRGYDLFTNIEKCKRGVCIYSLTELKAVPVEKLETIHAESVWAEIKLKDNDKLLIGCVYRSPNSNFESHCETRTCIEKAATLKYSHLLVNGDFNYPELTWNPQTSPKSEYHPASLFLENVRDNFLYQHVGNPTHARSDQSPTTIDLIITNEEEMLDNLNHTAPLGKSHHDCLVYNYRCYTKSEEKYTATFKLNKGNYDDLRHDLSNITWFEEENADIDEMWVEFHSKLLDNCHQHIPMTKQNTKGRKPDAPWMTDRVKTKIKEKKEAFKEKKKTTAMKPG